jgi:uncharacterized protein YpiB (UPF0302 family)
MKNDKKPNYYKKEMNLHMYMDSLNENDNTVAILTHEKTRYTEDAEEIIAKVQNEFLEKRRVEEIDLALTTKDKRRFMELTSANWKDAM